MHFHTHDTSGIAAATVLAAIEAGCDAVDGALDAMSGLTSQPNLGSIAAALRLSRRATRASITAPPAAPSHYWEGVRRPMRPFESDTRAGTSDVYHHDMPGGQYTNLREQARALGLEHRWPEVARPMPRSTMLFGDIVKVTPTSKVVGDMALFMVANDLKPADVSDPNARGGLPRVGDVAVQGRAGPARWRLSRSWKSKVLRGRDAAARPSRRPLAAGGSDEATRQGRTPLGAQPVTPSWRPI